MACLLEKIFCCCSGDPLHPRQITINGTTFKIMEVIGEGGFGFVYKAQDTDFGKKNARMSRNKVEGGGNRKQQQQQQPISAAARTSSNDKHDSTSPTSHSMLHHRSNSGTTRVIVTPPATSSPRSHASIEDPNKCSPKASLLKEGEHRDTRQSKGDEEVAIKRFILADAATLEERIRALAEAKHHQAASFGRHPNICCFYDSEVKRSHSAQKATNQYTNVASTSINATSTRSNMYSASAEVWVVMELCRGGSLQDAINYNLKHGGEFSAHEVLGIAIQCAAAVEHLHAGVPLPIQDTNDEKNSSATGVGAGVGRAAGVCRVPMAHWDLKLDNFLIADEPLKTTEDVRVAASKVNRGADNNASAGNINNANAGGGASSTSPGVSSAMLVSSAMGFVGGKSGVDLSRITVRLCDFGASTTHFLTPTSAQEVAAAEALLDSLMTLQYRAPETLDLWEMKKHNETLLLTAGTGDTRTQPLLSVDTKADVWALGVIFYLLLFQELPFDETKASIIGAAPKWSVPLPMWTRLDTTVNIKAKILDIVLTKMLIKNPAQRATVAEVGSALRDLANAAEFSLNYMCA